MLLIFPFDTYEQYKADADKIATWLADPDPSSQSHFYLTNLALQHQNIARAEKEIEFLKSQPLENSAPPRGKRSDCKA